MVNEVLCEVGSFNRFGATSILAI